MAASGGTSGPKRLRDRMERLQERFAHVLGLSILEGFQGYGYARSGVRPPSTFPAGAALRSTGNATRTLR